MKTVEKKCGEWVVEQYCVPGKKTQCRRECRDVCFDPNTCKTSCGKWKTCETFCCEGQPEVKCRKVWKERTVCEQVPCEKWYKETVTEKVPYTVCKKVPVTTVQKVSQNVSRTARGAYVDEKGCGYEC